MLPNRRGFVNRAGIVGYSSQISDLDHETELALAKKILKMQGAH